MKNKHIRRKTTKSFCCRENHQKGVSVCEIYTMFSGLIWNFHIAGRPDNSDRTKKLHQLARVPRALPSDFISPTLSRILSTAPLPGPILLLLMLSLYCTIEASAKVRPGQTSVCLFHTGAWCVCNRSWLWQMFHPDVVVIIERRQCWAQV